MDEDERNMHLRAGEAYGREATCGKKVDYKSEDTAGKSADAMTAKHGKEMEAYPCFWCNGWHIGRAMTDEEREQWSVRETPPPAP